MKKIFALIFIFMFSISLVNASCLLVTNLIEQDPYPATPGESVKLLFQVRGVENSNCKDVVFSIEPEYPFSLIPGQEKTITIKGGTYTQDFNSFLMIPYELKIDKDALEGNNKINIRYSQDKTKLNFIESKFDVNIRDVKTDFEIFIKDYDATQRKINFEILNIGKNDVEALTIEIPKQENIDVKGANKNIVGLLDSKDFTTASFEAIPSNGKIELIIHYIDIINERRTISKTVIFESDYFKDRVRDQKSTSVGFYIISVLLLAGVTFYFYNKQKKAKKKRYLLKDSE